MASQAQAFARADQLRRERGIWPGVVISRTGDARLTCDPDVPGNWTAPADTDPAPIAGSGANQICPPSDQPIQGGKSGLPLEPTGEYRP